MYGCEYRFLKQIYGDNHYSYVKYPEQITGEISRIHSFQFETRFFFPKNSALTNVEKHYWKPYHSKHEGTVISFTKRYKILRAFYTGWDDRYGFYLDDGWIYTYRSGFLIARFHIHQNLEDYILTDFQLCDETVRKSADLAIEEALYSCYYHF